eukprot:m.19143 g.19143  ORF g.19143 m.19143 type:complete len:119 (+) comp12182_c0_seq1:198-554(+)
MTGPSQTADKIDLCHPENLSIDVIQQLLSRRDIPYVCGASKEVLVALFYQHVTPKPQRKPRRRRRTQQQQQSAKHKSLSDAKYYSPDHTSVKPSKRKAENPEKTKKKARISPIIFNHT